MAKTLSKGFVLPEPGDSGRIVFAALEKNILLMNEIAPQAVEDRSISLSVVASQWSARFPSGYQTTISWTTTFDGRRGLFAFYLLPSNELVALRFKANPNNLVIYTNDNNINLSIVGIAY